jgi:hypothetical protein
MQSVAAKSQPIAAPLNLMEFAAVNSNLYHQPIEFAGQPGKGSNLSHFV